MPISSRLSRKLLRTQKHFKKAFKVNLLSLITFTPIYFPVPFLRGISLPSFLPSFLPLPPKVINDVESKTLAAASSKGLKLGAGQNMEAAAAVGKALGDIAKVPTNILFETSAVVAQCALSCSARREVGLCY